MEDATLRIICLLPSATEVVASCGMGDYVVGITHECDWPKEVVQGREVVTSSDISPYSMTQAEIHKAVCGSLENGHSLYGLDSQKLVKLRPTLVITQSLCDICAVSSSVVKEKCVKLVKDIDSADYGDPAILSLEPGNLQDMLDTIKSTGTACGKWRPEAVKIAEETVKQAQGDLALIESAVSGYLASTGKKKPKVAFMEWHDPIFTGGHWIADMLRIAGAEYGMATSSERSKAWTPEQLAEYDADVLLVGPCGFGVQRTEEDTLKMWEKQWWKDLKAVQSGQVYALDANSYYARPGPRLIQGTGIMASIIHGSEVEEKLGERLAPRSGWKKVVAPSST